MQVEALYEDGRLEFALPVHLKPGPVRVLIEIPDDRLVASGQASRVSEAQQAEQRPTALMTTPADAARPGPVREAIDAILAPYEDQLRPPEPLSAPDAKTAWHDHLEAKHLDRG